MRIFGVEIGLAAKPSAPAAVVKAAPNAAFVTSIPPSTVGWWPYLREGFAGAWQRGMSVPLQDAASHPTFWACVTLIAGDIAKCRPRLVQETADGICEEVDIPAYSPVIRRPNHYQNRIQFYAYWVICLLTRGNAYALKVRDARRAVTELYLLDPTRVKPLVAANGDVYYQLGQDILSGVTEASTVCPASEIIHDRINCLYHPLVGLSPVYACGHAAIQALTIVQNATKLFRRGSMIGGVLTAPGPISDEVATRLKAYWDANYAGEENIGAVAVLGDGLKFEKANIISAVDAQLIDQLKWDDEKICATLHVPPYMVSVGPLPSYNNVEALGQQYYGQCLQLFFEGIELCLSEGLELRQEPGGKWYEIEFDVTALDRMDSVQRMEVATKGVSGGVFTPNEGRRRFNLPPVPGGEKVYLQKQCWPLDLLGTDAKLEPAPAPPAPAPMPPAPAPTKELEIDEEAVVAEILRTLRAA